MVSLNFVPLRELQSTIYSRLHSVRSFDPPSHEWFMNMFDRLKQWLQNSPEPRGTQSTEGYAVSFHSEFEWCGNSKRCGQRFHAIDTVLLLFRPSPACPRPSQEALATCLSSSSYIIRIFKSLQRKNKINWAWLSVSTWFPELWLRGSLTDRSSAEPLRFHGRNHLPIRSLEHQHAGRLGGGT